MQGYSNKDGSETFWNNYLKSGTCKMLWQIRVSLSSINSQSTAIPSTDKSWIIDILIRKLAKQANVLAKYVRQSEK